ncbi:RNase adaptor protein RapZ [Comamonas serinivorans]|uniref:RNase adaptor protein RapZ n=1 Tax=Comamonas serinivorans TaxID=1082851 RepID=A0A1Y0ERU8_9BURK|nr:RNase adapter RapZ [Comamonas serinivorans]ARU06039.1 RNase adaptor protein RapZ [Comamonas serinivorans]
MTMDLVLITGMSGSGKSVALNALEDVGYYCVDNLPPELLTQLLTLARERHLARVAVAMDVRSAASLPQLPLLLASLNPREYVLRSIFLDASNETLVHRYSESRRRHPLSSHALGDDVHGLMEAIGLERDMLGDMRERAHVIDTSFTRAQQLRGYVKAVVEAPASALTLVFESFAFKRGLPVSADFVFDVRMLPNPHYDPVLRPLTGRDQPVIEFLDRQPEAQRMRAQVAQFVRAWLQPLEQDHRSYVTVAIGCTGGQHRSVYLVEQLAEAFRHEWTTLKRHRELDGKA